MARRLIWIALLLTLLLIGCAEKERGPDFRKGVRNVILIAVDTLAARNLGFMGYERPTSPFLDEFSRRCVVFDRAYTPKALTLPAFTSLFSGQHPITHNVQANGQVLPDDLHLLTEDFRDAGFLTIGVPASGVIGSRYGIARGFDHYKSLPAHEIPARLVLEVVRRFVEGSANEDEPALPATEKPIFLFVHFFDPHTDYTPDPFVAAQFAEPYYDGPVDGSIGVFERFNNYEIELDEDDLRHTRDLYDAEIRTLDHWLEKLLGVFQKAGLLDNSVIAFTADHGENLGEHHYITHGHPYEAGLHIPLMFHFPEDLGAATRIHALVELTDVLPTLLDAVDQELPEGIDGKSLLPVIEAPGEAQGGRRFLLSCGGFNDERKRTYGLFDGDNRLIKNIRWSDTTLLFDITSDPSESEDIAAKHPALAVQLETALDVMSTGELPPEEFRMDPETIEMLRSLGYLH